MNQVLFDAGKVSEMIKAGESLILAGDEQVLNKLPRGNWIGGTIPYFVGNNGGVFTQEKIYVTSLPNNLTDVKIKVYDETNIERIYLEAPENGLSIVIIPAASRIHQEFALKAPTFNGFASKPLIGWISGVPLANLGEILPKVFVGTDTTSLENAAVVLSIGLPKSTYANIGIINLFEEDGGETFFFAEDGFNVRNVIIDGKSVNFAEYLLKNKIDTKSPLVADVQGVKINTSFQTVNEAEGTVSLYSPVFRGVSYKIAKPVDNYIEDFRSMVPEGLGEKAFFSCNCILNYLYSELEGKKTGSLTGPITFGEVAYQLLNQTLVYVTLEEIQRDEDSETQAIWKMLTQ